MKKSVGWAAVACLVAACGAPSEGPALGEFAAMTKKETDKPFALTAPSSKSPATFVYTSSNLAVATVEGDMVTIVSPGQTTISAAQPSYGSYGPTHTSATLTVSVACTSPATVVNYACTAPASSATATTVNGRIWARVVHNDTWVHASDYCTGTVIDNVGNWRLPTQVELAELVASGAIAGHGWTLGSAWSSSAAGGMNGGHVVVDLTSGATADRADGEVAYVSCVR